VPDRVLAGDVSLTFFWEGSRSASTCLPRFTYPRVAQNRALPEKKRIQG
jgi:hypothetical protein